MTVRLDWHSATAKHRQDLRNFRCADPANAEFDEEHGFVVHDAPWEFVVQEHINGLKPQLRPPSYLLVGYDREGLAAVIETIVFPLDRHAFIPSIGVAHRVSGIGLAGEAVERVGANVLPRHGIASDYYLSCRIDPDNTAAQSVFKRQGFEITGHNGKFERWAHYSA